MLFLDAQAIAHFKEIDFTVHINATTQSIFLLFGFWNKMLVIISPTYSLSTLESKWKLKLNSS